MPLHTSAPGGADGHSGTAPNPGAPGQSAPAQSDGTEDDSADDTEDDAADGAGDGYGLQHTDFGNLEWIFRQGGNTAETITVALRNGEAELDLVRYVQDEVIHADLNGDGHLDAAARLTQLDGNSVDQQWYLWIATQDGPQQVTLPVARMSRCGDVIKSVEAVDAGIQIHEVRRGIEDFDLACAQEGTDERVRTIIAVPARAEGEWWPAQVAPAGGFGGLCPIAAEWDAYEHVGDLYPAPDTRSPEITDGAMVGIFGLEPWPIYGEDFPGWVLVGVLSNHGEYMRCAWAETGT